MAAASRDTKGHKRRQPRSVEARTSKASKRKTASARSTPLNAKRDATLKQEIQGKRRENSEQMRDGNAMPLPSRELIELMNRRACAFLEFPMRMARCRTPFALWSEQARFVHDMINDCQSLAQRMMR
jgi:hypothetical protein